MRLFADPAWVLTALELLAALFIFVLGVAVLLVVAVYVMDVTQTKQALRCRNYPVIVHFHYGLERLGQFFRQYFFAMDREECLSTGRNVHGCYRAAKDLDNTVALGSTRDLHPAGSVLFVNTPFPTLDEDAVEPRAVTIGPDCLHPFVTAFIFNISGMSYGAISKPAVLALSRAAQRAGCGMNTGEGGLTTMHLEGGADIVFQIGTAKNGVRDLEGQLDETRLREVAGHRQVRLFEIKLAGRQAGQGRHSARCKGDPRNRGDSKRPSRGGCDQSKPSSRHGQR